MKNDITIEQVAVTELKPAEYNPRKWSEHARKGLTASLGEFGFVQPIVVNSAPNRRGVIIGGNFKLDIAKEKGMTTVPVVWVNIPDLKKEKELNLRLNKNQGEFDNDLLAEFEQEMLKEVGWDSKELDKIFDDKSEDDYDGDKEAEKIITPVAKYGDVYELGRHRLMCGDSSKIEDVEKLRGGGQQADMVFTDPPYNVNYSGRGKSTSNTIKNDNMDEQAFRTMLNAWFKNYSVSLKENGALYCCYASRTHREFEDAINANGFEVRNQIIWVKKVASMGWGDYRWKHEPILYCHKKGAKLDFFGDRKQYTEWTEEMSDEELLKMVKGMVKKEEEGDSTVWRLHREMKYDHPTQKPIKLVSIAIRNSSKRGDVVMDLFGGSGSTLIAADGLNRTAWIMELDPKYVDVIIKRWEKQTGEKAKKISI
jgi:DNA modification methylase